MSKVTERKIRQGLTLYQAYIKDDTGTIIATWYNQPYIKKVLTVGESYIFYGKIVRDTKPWRCKIRFMRKPARKNIKYNENCARLPCNGESYTNTIRTVMQNALELVDGNLEDVLPLWVRKSIACAI